VKHYGGGPRPFQRDVLGERKGKLVKLCKKQWKKSMKHANYVVTLAATARTFGE
jgi:hypothetical protein